MEQQQMDTIVDATTEIYDYENEILDSVSDYFDEYEYCYDTNSESSNTISSTSTAKHVSRLNKKKEHISGEKIYLEHTPERLKITVFPTRSSRGYQIRNAITGIHTNHYVGKKEEAYYFKVRFLSSKLKNGTDLYYDSPSQFEKHFKLSVREDVVQKWTDVRNTLLKSQREKRQLQESRQITIIH